MPVVKFDTPKDFADNKGSCNRFIEYLSKEDKSAGLFKEYFFNHKNEMICDYEVVSAIDNNCKAIGKEEVKFYTGSINFSEPELLYLKNDNVKIRNYSIKVFEEYANNYNKALSIDDINWFAKIESNRYYKGDDNEVIEGKVKQGEIKPGNNIHVHFIIGRKSVNGKQKLSPLTNHIATEKGPVKGGFNRDKFKENTEKLFDNMFSYLRPMDESYEYNKINKKGTVEQKYTGYLNLAELNISRSQYNSLPTSKKDIKITKLTYFILFNSGKGMNLKLDYQRLNDVERNFNYDGSTYRSLLNLNWNIKKGRIPQNKDLTEDVINYAEFLHSNPWNNSIEKNPLFPNNAHTQKSEQIHTHSPSSNTGNQSKPMHSVAPIIHDDSEDEFKKKRKKKRKKDNDISY